MKFGGKKQTEVTEEIRQNKNYLTQPSRLRILIALFSQYKKIKFHKKFEKQSEK